MILSSLKPPNSHSNESFHFLSVEGTSFVDCAYCLNKGGFISDFYGANIIEIVMTHQVLDNTLFNHLKCNSFKFLRTNGEGLSWNDLEKKTLPFISGKMTLSGEKNHKI